MDALGAEVPVLGLKMFNIQPLIKGKELFELVVANGREMTSENIFRWFFQILSGTLHLHTNGYIHRDLKLENVMWDAKTNSARIFDFGFTVPRGHAEFKCASGTPGYCAPEVIKGKVLISDEFNDGREEKTDAFSAGSIGFALMMQSVPWLDEDVTIYDFAGKRNIFMQQLVQNHPGMPEVAAKMADKVIRMCDPDPIKRLSVRDCVLEILADDDLNPLYLDVLPSVEV